MTPNAPTTPKPDVFAALPRLDRHKPKCGPVRPSKAGRWRAAVLIGVHVLIGIHILQWKLTGTTLTPVEPSESIQTLTEGRLNAGFVLFVVLIASTLVFGRWFCGWACHVVALQDLCAWLLGKFRLRPRPVRSRLLVIAPFAVATYMFAWPDLLRLWQQWFGTPLPPRPELQAAFLTDAFWRTFPGPLMGVLSFAVVGFLIVWWLGAKGFCTYGCPYGAIFGVADRVAPGKIRVTDACEGCGHCTSVCSSNVRVHEEVAKYGMVVDPGCMKCLDCVSVCPKDALYFGFGTSKPFTRSQQRIAARADFTWPEELTLALFALLAFGSFHGAWFGESVPLLLAVGLAVITAVLSLLAVRLVRRREMTFQHRALKLQGRFTSAGRWVLLAIAAWLLLTVDTGVVSFYSWRSEVASAAVSPREQKVQRAAELRAIDDTLATAVAFALVDDPKLHFRRGMVQRELGATLEEVSLFVSAEAELRRALLLNPDFASAIVPLTDLLNLRGATDEIEPLLLHALQLQPNDNGARVRLERLRQRRGK